LRNAKLPVDHNTAVVGGTVSAESLTSCTSSVMSLGESTEAVAGSMPRERLYSFVHEDAARPIASKKTSWRTDATLRPDPWLVMEPRQLRRA
jgi:hypothetical protein